MIYNSFSFLIFFPFLFILYYIIPVKRKKCRNGYLLLVSYLLYLSFKPVYALFLLGLTLVTFYFSIWIEKRKNNKRLLVIGVLLALFPLSFFKYYSFVNCIVLDILLAIGIRFQLPGLNWAIPVGISYITFQALGYMLDVYNKRINAEKDFFTYALFVSFFPSVVAGPINKASLIIPQLKALRPYFDYEKAVAGLKMLLWGMFMKVVVADRVALYVDTVMPNYMNYTGVTCLAACFLYSIQIYADFAGYSLMAIGVGKIMGIDLTENFRRPFFAISITDFWHRWHMSLSTWLKDYIYIPLGGSRCSRIRNYLNIIITFLVSGIWHGASWTFVIWGLFNGVIQIVEKLLGVQKYDGKKHSIRFVRTLYTFILFNIALVFIRMPSIEDSISFFSRILDTSLPVTLYLSALPNPPLIIFGCLSLFMKDFIDEYYPHKFLLMNNSSIIVRWSTYVVLIVAILSLGVFSSDQFIYASF